MSDYLRLIIIMDGWYIIQDNQISDLSIFLKLNPNMFRSPLINTQHIFQDSTHHDLKANLILLTCGFHPLFNNPFKPINHLQSMYQISISLIFDTIVDYAIQL